MNDFAIDNAYNIPLVNKMLNLMKDEKNSTIMIEFVRAKISTRHIYLPDIYHIDERKLRNMS